MREGTTKADDAFNSRQLKDMFKTVIYNNNPNVRKKITTIGIAFSFQKYNKLPTSKLDIKLDYILTEKGLQK